jgi:dTDP-4-dehydrorhamnose 3,5-epimerase
VKFAETEVPGVWVVEPTILEDERGSFARTFDVEQFAEHGMDTAVVQCNTSFNARTGTLRGMHYQAEPHGEAKLIRCTRGAIHDVVVDLRPDSPTYRRWCATELAAESGRMVFAPVGVAHGFQTLVDGTEVHYQMSHVYVREAAQGVRWDDPAFGIEWPPGRRIISDRDRSYPDFRP